MRIFLDVTRCLGLRFQSTPTGIDRVDQAYVRRLLEKQDIYDPLFIVTTPYGKAALSPKRMHKILSQIDSNQHHRDKTGDNHIFHSIKSLLQSAPDTKREKTARFVIGHEKSVPVMAYLEIFRESLIGMPGFWRALRENGNERIIYLHTSHIQLENPHYYGWTRQKNVHPVFFDS